MANNFIEIVHRKRNANGPSPQDKMFRLLIRQLQTKTTLKYSRIYHQTAKRKSLTAYSFSETVGKKTLRYS